MTSPTANPEILVFDGPVGSGRGGTYFELKGNHVHLNISPVRGLTRDEVDALRQWLAQAQTAMSP